MKMSSIKKHDDKKTKRFFDKWTKSDSISFTRRLSDFHLRNCPRDEQEKLFNMLESASLAQLSEFSVDYDANYSIDEIRNLRQVIAFYGKNSDLGSTDGRKRKMLQNFADSEIRNQIFNIRINHLLEWNLLWYHADSLFWRLSQKISHILGECPCIDDLKPEFGPGSSTTVKKRTTARFKLEASPVCPPEMAYFIREYGPELLPLYFGVHEIERLNENGHGELSGVPKDWETLRSIITEAVLATFWQKPIGSIIKQRLLLHGINLKDQSRNRELALLGSLTGEVCTVDVKGASNSVALMLVYILVICPYWFELLSMTRTGSISIEGELHTLEMFSSMGNGYTFELESVIFYAIALLATEDEGGDLNLVSVFGDDIIVPTCAYARLVRYLGECNFEVNTKKSFASGPFRESCGHDYYFGINVRPFYLKDRWTYARLVGYINHQRRSYMSRLDYVPLEVERFLWSLEELIPEDLRLYGPDGFGDGHIVFYYDPDTVPAFLKPVKRTKKQELRHGTCHGYKFSTFVKIPRFSRDPLQKGDALFPYYSIDVKPPKKVFTENDYSSDPMDFLSKGDPYAISGGFKEKVQDIYILGTDTQHCHVSPVFPRYLNAFSVFLTHGRTKNPTRCYWYGSKLRALCECFDCSQE